MNKSNLILASVSAIIFTSILIIFSPNSQKLNFSSSAPSLTPFQSISSTPDPTADWKTYENKEYGFSFKYPSNYSFDENNPLPNKKGYLQVSIMSPLDHQNDKRTTLNSKELKMEIYIEPQQVNDSLDKFFNEGARTDGNPLGPYSNTTISGVSAIKLNWEGMGDGTSYYLLSGDNRIVITKYPQLTELDTVFSQILSTFKFFSSTTPTKSATTSAIPKDWKTYTNSTYNLSFKYPSDYKVTILNEAINLQKNSTRALLYISKFSNPNTLDISQWFDGQPKEDIQPIKDAHIMTNIIVGGQKALMFTKTKPETGYKDFMIIVGSKTNVYYLNFGPLDSEVDTSTQILSTFKFL